MDENGVVEEGNGPREALVIPSENPRQENVLCHKCQWRLCVSYPKPNQFTRPFTFPIPRCDGEVQDIDTEVKYFIAVYIYSGYWQVLAEE